MFGRLFGNDPGAAFWRWIEHNQNELEAEVRAMQCGGPLPQLAMHDLGARLSRVGLGLVHEIGVHTSNDIELIISADGDRGRFATVQELVSQAPRMKGWRITAFRPRTDTSDTELTVSGIKVRAEQFSFRARAEGDKVGFDVFVDADVPNESLPSIGFLMLDATLGEFDVETGVGTVDFAKGRPIDALNWSELSSVFDSHRPSLARA